MTSFSTIELAVFLILFSASAAGFAMRAARIVKIILASKKDPNFTLHPLAKRIWDFILEVMCQSKVIRHRPAPPLPQRVGIS